MNKQQFLGSVRLRLAGLPQADVERYLDYIREMIDDRMEDGLSEEEAVAAMGSPEYVASQLLMDAPPARQEPAKKPRRDLEAWQVVLIVLGAPIWAPVLFGVLMALFGITVSLFATLFGLYCAAGGLIAAGLGLVFAGPVQVAMPDLLFLLAAGFFLMGLGLLWILALNWVDRMIIRFCKWLYRKIRGLFSRKEG